MSEIMIKNLNGLKRNNHLGLYKKGLVLSNNQYHLVCDYLEKINYSLQDIERELKKKSDNSVLIIILVFVCWIQESVHEIKKSYKNYAIEKAITSPDFLIRLATELKNEQEQRKALETKIEEDKPYTSLGTAVSSSQGSILIRELSKLLNQNGIDIGEKRLYSWLRDNGFVIKKKGNDYNLPTQKSMNLGLMEVKERVISKYGKQEITSTTKITGKGQEYFINKFLHMNDNADNLIVI